MTSKTITGRDIHHNPAELDIDKLTWRPGAYALVFNEAGKVLVVENTKNNRYEFPGGGVEIHENFEEALIREVWEETGLTIEIKSLITMIEDFFRTPSGNHWHTVKCFYRCRPVNGTLRPTILDDEPIVNPQFVDPAMLTQDNVTIGWKALEIVMS